MRVPVLELIDSDGAIVSDQTADVVILGIDDRGKAFSDFR